MSALTGLQVRYQQGRIPFTACQSDPRFSYCLYLPEIHFAAPDKVLPLVVVIHGSSRTAESFRDHFIPFAERVGCAVLVPLFPVGIPTRDDAQGYKMQQLAEIRYDQLLLSMVEEIRQHYSLDQTFCLYGFSGGAQFAHRFLYLQPHSLCAISIVAPGNITLLDNGLAWPQGLGDLNTLFGQRYNMAAIRAVPVQLVIGTQDTEPLPWLHCAPCTRRALLEKLYANYTKWGVVVQWNEVVGIGHNGYALLPETFHFFAEQLAKSR